MQFEVVLPEEVAVRFCTHCIILCGSCCHLCMWGVTYCHLCMWGVTCCHLWMWGVTCCHLWMWGVTCDYQGHDTVQCTTKFEMLLYGFFICTCFLPHSLGTRVVSTSLTPKCTFFHLFAIKRVYYCFSFLSLKMRLFPNTI